MKKISIFTPCYNEEGNVYEMYSAITKIMKGFPQYEYEYVFIDNASQDKTATILREIASKDKHVKVILNTKNFGASRSGSYGFYQTTGDVTINLACDFQDPPELIPEMIRKWEEGYKVVWGKKTSSDENKLMFLTRCLFYRIMRKMASDKQYENVTGFGLYDREVVDLMKRSGDPSPSFRNLVAEYGYDVEIIEFHQPVRKEGKSSYNFFKYVDAAMNMIINTSQMPIRLMTYLGIIVAVLSFLVGMVYLVLKLIYWDSFNIGQAPLVCGLFFLGAIQILFIGIIGEYVGEILNRHKARPLVIEKERINFDE